MELLGFFASAWVTLFVVVDPVAAVPVFLAMTTGDSAAARRLTARRAALVAAGILAVFAVFGGLVFRLLGVSLAAFQIAGGLLLLLLATDMLRAERSRQRTTPEEVAEGAVKDDVSVFPLAIPMLAGPGATSAVMVLSARSGDVPHSIAFGAALTLVVLATYLILRASSRIADKLGKTGLNVLQRVMGLVVAAFAVEFVLSGLKQAFPGWS